MTGGLTLDELLREVRARVAPPRIDRETGVAIYARSELAGVETADLIERIRELQRRGYVDTRLDLFEVTDAGVQAAASTVAMVVEASRIEPAGDRLKLRTSKLAEKHQLCEGERFRDQPCVGFCSAVLVAPMMVATAAHCIRGARPEHRLARLAAIRFVFGYRMVDAGAAALELPRDAVYQGTRLVAFDASSDWAVVELERAVTAAAPATIRRKGRIADASPVSVIGHPCGLPLKYGPGARVRSNHQAAGFRADLDAFGGNSGSPVFGADWTVEGLLISGAPDFVRDGPCKKALVVPVRDELGDPPGEDCVRATQFAAAVPES